GDTVTFEFISDERKGYYGYYAIVTGEALITEVSEEAQANIETEQESAINQVLYEAQMCTDTDHGGYGCMSYSGFYYNDTDRNYLYYPSASESRIDVVQPAAEIDADKWACNVPDATTDQFYEAIDHNPDCWDVEFIGSGSGHCLSGSSVTKGASNYLDGYCDGSDSGYKVISKSSHSFTVYVYVDVDHDHHDGEKDCSYTILKYRFTHNCKGTHTGYYCGGHLKLVVYGLVYHITKAERENNHDLYKDKVESIGTYYKAALDQEVISDRIKKAEDLFDIDMGIIHVDKSVADGFEGWTYDNMDDAATKLEDDWEDLYGIQVSYTIAGINGVSSGTGTVNTASIAAHIKAVMDQIRDEDTKNLRLQALVKAFTYVGQIGYSQSAHGSPLTIGGLNDCSGYASRVWENVFYSRIYTTETFKDLAIEYDAYYEYSDGQIQPGDILLHGMQTSATDDNHALIYVGNENGTVMSIDCSSPTVQYRSRGESYYNGCMYINMNIFIRAYLSEHPEADEEPSILSETTLVSGVSSGINVDVSNLTIPNLSLNYEGGLPIVYYSQSSGSPWASVLFGGGTISSSGCSVTSLGMVLTYLQCGSDVSDADAIITPDEVVATIAAHNGGNYNRFYVSSSGQSWDIFPNVANYYGIHCAQINSGSIIASLQAGRPVIMSCKPGIFTSGGHFIVLTGYDATTGLIYVNDPNGSHASYSLNGYTLSTIKSQGKGWWSFWN
ncbi:MAG: C39 family peptidase, partial [Clostridiales bacterium]|nr:C39 family peptidase [Clostridiales bacterium]